MYVIMSAVGYLVVACDRFLMRTFNPEGWIEILPGIETRVRNDGYSSEYLFRVKPGDIPEVGNRFRAQWSLNAIRNSCFMIVSTYMENHTGSILLTPTFDADSLFFSIADEESELLRLSLTKCGWVLVVANRAFRRDFYGTGRYVFLTILGIVLAQGRLL